MTPPIKTNRILALRMPEVSSTLKEKDDDVQFATDMEEPVCEGSEEHNHAPTRTTSTRNKGCFLWISKSRHKRDYCRLDNSLKLVLEVVSNTEQLWRSF